MSNFIPETAQRACSPAGRLLIPASPPHVPAGVSDEEDQKPVRLPLKVAVELQPRSNYSWARVQNLAHNPRLRYDAAQRCSPDNVVIAK